MGLLAEAGKNEMRLILLLTLPAESLAMWWAGVSDGSGIEFVLSFLYFLLF